MKPMRKETARFIEIYNYVADPCKEGRINYEIAEAEYLRQYGTRRWGKYKSFIEARSRFKKQ